MWPAWLRSPARVGIELSAPVESRLPDGRRRVGLEAAFFADFEGPGRYEIVEGCDTVRFRSVWAGVERRHFLRVLPAALVFRVHMNAERGTLSFPFPPGTGFGGLAHRLGVEL